MGFKYTLKKLIGQSVTDDSGAAGEDKDQVVAAGDDKDPVEAGGNVHPSRGLAVEQKSVVSKASPDSLGKDENQTTERHVGRKWEHKHDDLDWHSMSILHPVPLKAEAEKEVASETVAPLRVHQIDASPDHELYKDKRISKKDILCKFVVQHGQRIGETISIDGGHLVFKHGAEKLYISMSSISGFTDEDVEIGDFNRDEALKLGEEWHQRTTNSLKFDENGMLIND